MRINLHIATIVLFSALVMSGCFSGMYRYSISEEVGNADASLRYDIVDSIDPNDRKLNVGDDVVYNESVMPVVVKQTGDLTPHKVDFGWTGVLCCFTLGLFPAFDGEEASQSVTVETPIGAKTGSYKVESRMWMGWIPLFVGYPAFAEEREARASLPNPKLANKAKDELVSALVGKFPFKEYVEFAKKENVDRKNEIERMSESRTQITELLKNKRYDEAARRCEKDSSPRRGSLKKDEIVWSEIRSRIADEKEDYRVMNKKSELELMLAEFKFEDVVSACGEENCGAERHASIWSSLKGRAENAISDRDRKIEMARVEKRKAAMITLLNEKKYTEVISECNKEVGANAGSRPEDSAIWSAIRNQAQTEQDKIDRLVEEKRIAAKMDCINKLLSERKFAEVIRLCDEERGQNAGSRPEDLTKWKSIRARAYANETLVLKGFYPGMPREDAEELCRNYLGAEHGKEVAKACVYENGNLKELTFSRADIDKMFGVTGVSCEVFVKKLLEAYLIIGKFDIGTEEVPDVERQAKVKKDIMDRSIKLVTAMAIGGNYGNNYAAANQAGYNAGVQAMAEYDAIKDSITKFSKVYRCENKKGFILEIHEGLAEGFLVLRKTDIVNISNFD